MANNGVNLASFKERVEDLLALYSPKQERTQEVRASVNSIFTQYDADNNKVLDETELKSAITFVKTLIQKGKESTSGNNTVETPQPARNPKFRGLESYNLVMHGTKEDIGMITVNGENMLVWTFPDSGEFELYRCDPKTKQAEYLTFKNMDELKKALSDSDRDWGKYPGFEDINEPFIP